MRRDPTTATSCDHREQNECDPLRSELASFPLRRPEAELLSETRLNFSTLKIFFSSLTAAEPRARSGRSLVFHYKSFLSGPPSKKSRGLSASQRTGGELSVCCDIRPRREITCCSELIGRPHFISAALELRQSRGSSLGFRPEVNQSHTHE